MSFLSGEDWANYEETINQFHNDAFQQEISWIKPGVVRNIHGESTGDKQAAVILKGLIQYNYFRAWATTAMTKIGEIDKESLVLYLNIEALKTAGHLTTNDQLDFDPALDRFFIKGQEYKAMGDSHIAQANDKPLLLFIILKREETNTGEPVRA